MGHVGTFAAPDQVYQCALFNYNAVIYGIKCLLVFLYFYGFGERMNITIK